MQEWQIIGFSNFGLKKNVRSSSALYLYTTVCFMNKNIEQGAKVPPHHMMYDANINN